MYINGALEYVDCFAPEGEALISSFDFPGLGENIPVYPYPHPEQVTLPNTLRLKQVTNRGVVLPLDYYDLTRDLCRLGFNDKTPIEIQDQSISPYEFALEYILRKREQILKQSQFGGPKGCVSVVVKGKKGNDPLTYQFHLTSQSEALGEGTGIPAAMGALLMLRGKVTKKGVLAPEAAINPNDFLQLMPLVLGRKGKSKKEGDFNGIIVDRIDDNGQCHRMKI
jgi:saccharopine dehydrogenase (NAD+, L-lysine-forming)